MVEGVATLIQLAFSDLGVDLSLVGQAITPRLLVSLAIAELSLGIALVGQPIAGVSPILASLRRLVALVRRAFSRVGQPFAFVRLALADLGIDLSLVGQSRAMADFRRSVRHGRNVLLS